MQIRGEGDNSNHGKMISSSVLESFSPQLLILKNFKTT